MPNKKHNEIKSINLKYNGKLQAQEMPNIIPINPVFNSKGGIVSEWHNAWSSASLKLDHFTFRIFLRDSFCLGSLFASHYV